MKGFSAWPGKICFPPEGMKRPVMKKQMHCVEFFGTHDFAWILEPDCKPYLEFRETLGTSKKSPSLKKAIEETDDFIAGKKGGLDVKPMSITTDSKYDGNPTKEDAEFDALFGDSGEKKTRGPDLINLR